MATTISELKTTLGQGQRSSKYKIYITGDGDLSDFNVLCSQSSFPSVSITPIEVYKQGRKIMLPGETEYENTWTVTVYQTEEHDLRNKILDWKDKIDDYHENKHQGDLDQMMSQGCKVVQLNAQGDETVTYRFQNMFPSGVGQVELSDETTNTIQTFDVTFSLTYWEIEG